MEEKVLVLLSGGLDSLITVKILQEQNISVEAVYIKLPFSKDREKEIKEFCDKEDLNLKIIDGTSKDLFKKYMQVIKKPEYGRGSGFNPCIDCRAFMLKQAKKLADKKEIRTIATGEVLNERPMTQNKKAMRIIKKETGLKGRLLRPLSAKLLSETDAEKEGKINRKKLLDIKGRSRKKQIEIAEKYGLEYPQPAGGCRLCEPEYSEKLKRLLDKKNLEYNDIKLLSVGRHFKSSQIILGKNEEENKKLQKEKGIKLVPKQPGPTALIKHWKDNKKKLIEQAKKLITEYTKHNIKEIEKID